MTRHEFLTMLCIIIPRASNANKSNNQLSQKKKKTKIICSTNLALLLYVETDNYLVQQKIDKTLSELRKVSKL